MNAIEKAMNNRIHRRIKEMDKLKENGTSTEYDRGYKQAKKDVFNDIWKELVNKYNTDFVWNDEATFRKLNELKQKHLGE